MMPAAKELNIQFAIIHFKPNISFRVFCKKRGRDICYNKYRYPSADSMDNSSKKEFILEPPELFFDLDLDMEIIPLLQFKNKKTLYFNWYQLESLFKPEFYRLILSGPEKCFSKINCLLYAGRSD